MRLGLSANSNRTAKPRSLAAKLANQENNKEARIISVLTELQTYAFKETIK
jgi:hypothetical protein